MWIALAAGFGLSFVGALPVAGPVAVLAVERALTHRGRHAIGLALGAAVPEAFYAGAAAMGAEVILERWPHLAPWAQLVGMVVLGGVAVHTWLAARQLAAKEDLPAYVAAADPAGAEGGAAHAMLTGFALTGLNPTMLLTWSAVSAPLAGAGALSGTIDAVALAVGAGLGGFLGTCTLAAVVGTQRHRLGPKGRRAIRYLAATALLLLAAWLGVSALRGWGG